MEHKNATLGDLIKSIDFGSSIAESDNLLEAARVETSAFTDLLNDRVDLIPGTKGSGKSALFRIVVDFLPDFLLDQRKVVVAHGVQNPGDPVFQAFNSEFSKLNEHEFVSFWCIYLVSLAHEQFIKGERYSKYLSPAAREINAFRLACQNANIPEIKAKKSLYSILEWTLHVLSKWRPKIKYKSPEIGEIEVDLFGQQMTQATKQDNDESNEALPRYVKDIKETLEAVLEKSKLSLWLMIDRLDEIFPRRSQLERTALRGLLRAMRFFESDAIRVKVFLRDDMLDQVVRGSEGFTALTHITARQADTLRWTEDQILSMVVKRLFVANQKPANYLKVDRKRLEASSEYREQTFYRVFPRTVHRGPKQTTTLRWLCSRCADGRGVVTPRDVIDLLGRAKQRQQDEFTANPDGTSDYIIGPGALQYGLEELSSRKRQTYLQAEFPHLWGHIEKFVGGKTEYDEAALQRVLSKDWKPVADDLVSIGLLAKKTSRGKTVFSIPYLYRHGLELTRGKA